METGVSDDLFDNIQGENNHLAKQGQVYTQRVFLLRAHLFTIRWHTKTLNECNRPAFWRIGLDRTVIDACMDIMTMVGRRSSKHGATRGMYSGGIEPDSAEQPRD